MITKLLFNQILDLPTMPSTHRYPAQTQHRSTDSHPKSVERHHVSYRYQKTIS